MKTLVDLVKIVLEMEDLNLSDFSVQSFDSQEFAESISKMTQFFLQSGVKDGAKIAMFLESSVRFFVVDFAAISTGCVTVPMFSTMCNENIKFQIENCQPEFLVVEDLLT